MVARPDGRRRGVRRLRRRVRRPGALDHNQQRGGSRGRGRATAVTSGPNGTGFNIFVAATVSSGDVGVDGGPSAEYGLPRHHRQGRRRPARPGPDVRIPGQPALREEPLTAWSIQKAPGQGARVRRAARRHSDGGGVRQRDTAPGPRCDTGPLTLRRRHPPRIRRSSLPARRSRSPSFSTSRDRSQTAGATQEVRDATNALAQGLVDTGASMAVFKFSTQRSSSTIAPVPDGHPGVHLGAARHVPGRVQPQRLHELGRRAWSDANATAADPPDLVIFLTDGNPNRFGTAAPAYRGGLLHGDGAGGRRGRSDQGQTARTCSSSASAPASPTR